MINRKEQIRRQIAELCGDYGFDDGVDPRVLARKEDSRRAYLRKDRQLCSQVLEVLCIVVGNIPDAWAQGLQIGKVEPAPDASRLRVIVTFDDERPIAEALSCLVQLDRRGNQLRSEVAREINRKRAPSLFFALQSEDGEGE